MRVSKFVEEGRRGLPGVGAARGGVEASFGAVHPPHAAALCRRSWYAVTSLGTTTAAHGQLSRSLLGEGVSYGYLEGNTNFDFSFTGGRTIDLNAFENSLERSNGEQQMKRGKQRPVVRAPPAQPRGASESERGRERGRAGRGATHVLLRLGPSRH